MKQVLAAQHRILGDTDPTIRNVMQTNLLHISDRQLDWLAASGFSLNVSMDGATGVRMDRCGRDTTDRMLANLGRLTVCGIPWGAGVTLGAHNRNSLRDTYDLAAQYGAGWISVTPMFMGDGSAPIGGLRTGASEAVSALSDLFAHWIERGRTVPVQPLLRCLWSVSGIQQAVPSHERHGPAFYETHFVVRPDGSLTSDLVSPIVLGNVLRHSMSEILRSAGMERAVMRRELLTDRHCALCRFQPTCDHRAVMDYPDEMPSGPCSIESALCEYIAAYSQRTGRAPLELLGWRSL
jgi:sulfatase maturation enzyme AslB (radical SAM superfamily)